jgi:CheY-like chemotaxis protein
MRCSQTIHAPGLNGLSLCEQLLADRGDVPILLTSAVACHIGQIRARDAGVEYVMSKRLSAGERTFWRRDEMQEILGY